MRLLSAETCDVAIGLPIAQQPGVDDLAPLA
jgi:hypothetical protein